MKIKKIHIAILLLLASSVISFLGSLPPGTANVMTLGLAAHDPQSALWFTCGCLIGEMIYVGLCSIMIDRLMRFNAALKLLGWISFGVLTSLALISFLAAFNTQTSFVAEIPEGSPVIAGTLVMLLNPLQVPFWLGWTTVLFEKRILRPRISNYIIYITGVGIGSLSASLIFIWAGSSLSTWIDSHSRLWQIALGIFFSISAVHQVKIIPAKRSFEASVHKFNGLAAENRGDRLKSPSA